MNYSGEDDLQYNQYESILRGELGYNIGQRHFKNLNDATKIALNGNIPRLNKSYTITVGNTPVKALKEFWQFKSYAGALFTDWTSAGISNNYEDLSVKNLPFNGKINPDLVLSNTNNIRSNLQNYGDYYLDQTEMLNNQAFDVGSSFKSGLSTPYRAYINNDNIKYGTEAGDKYSRSHSQLALNNPINYSLSLSTWSNINPICIRPNHDSSSLNFNDKLKHGYLNLDSLKSIGSSCVTKNFNGMKVDFLNTMDGPNPPLYEMGLYCSANNNYVAMPINFSDKFKNVDSSFSVAPGEDSVVNGTIMTNHLKNFINTTLYEINEALIALNLYQSNNNISQILPHLFSPRYNKTINIKYNNYMKLSDQDKYNYISDLKNYLVEYNQQNLTTSNFISNLSIYKFAGKVKLSLISNDYLDINGDTFVLLPSMLNDNLFTL